MGWLSTARPCDLRWKPFPSHDDGVLVWVRLDSVGGEAPLDEPVIVGHGPTGDTADRGHPRGRCLRAGRHHRQPARPLARRLVSPVFVHPARGADHARPSDDDRFLVSVTFRMGRFGVPVIAEFTTPDARTVVMRIIEGEGTGSVVETHATPTASGPDGRRASTVIEATIASSPAPGFAVRAARGPLITPLMRHAATRLWRDDLAYAERRYRLRTGGQEGRKTVDRQELS